MNWHIEGIEVCERCLNTDINNGLTAQEAERRIKKYGRNSLKDEKIKTFWELFRSHFIGPLPAMVFAAAVVSVIIAVNAPEIGNWQESLVVALLMVVRSLAYAACDLQNIRTNNELEQLDVRQARVIRDGKEQFVSADELTQGDIILLSAGDIVPADCRLISCSDMTCDERSISGEAVSAEKCAEIRPDVTAPINERVNMLYSGCPVLSGQGRAVITAVGRMTVIGRQARLSIGQETDMTPGQYKFGQVLRKLAIGTIVVCVLILIIGFANRYEHDLKAIEVLMTAAALSAIVLPKGINTLVGTVVTQGRSRAVKHGAYIADRTTVEELDRLSVICSDKTGTLTESHMILTEAWAAGGKICKVGGYIDKATVSLLSHAALCSNFRPGDMDDPGVRRSTDRAIVMALLEHDIKKTHLEMKNPRVAELPFTRGSRLMTTVHQYGGGYLVITKGAPDALIPLCVNVDEEKAYAVVNRMGRNGLREIAVGYRMVDDIPMDELSDNEALSERLERDLIFEGVLGIANPPRADVGAAIARCEEAGIRVVMMTAEDEPAAMTVSSELGIMRDGDEIMTGEELAAISDDEFVKKVRKVSAYARISRQDKRRIVQAWKSADECVGITGDVVGDTATLKEADVGFAMGRSGVSAAMVAADVTVIDDSFMTIADAVREGRSISDNSRNAMRLIFTYSIAELIAMLVCIIRSGTVPLLSVHLLMLALITGIVPMLTYAYRSAHDDVMRRKPHRIESAVFSRRVTVIIAFQSLLLSALTVIAFAAGQKYGIDIARTMAYVTLALSQITLLIEMRWRDFLSSTNFKGHSYLLIGVGIMIVLLVVSVTAMRDMLLFASLGWIQWKVILLLAMVPVLSAELIKGLRVLLGKYMNTQED